MMHAVGMRRGAGEWGVGLISREAGIVAWLSPDQARELAAGLEQMATIAEAPRKPPQ